LRVIDAEDNQQEGRRLGNFVVSCGLTSGTPAAPISGEEYLVVPLPYEAAPPTTFVCAAPG